jgi:hypothetical protein
VAIRIEPRSAGIGARIHIDVQSPLSDVRIDLFQPDGSVRHLPRQGRGPAEWTAAPPAGARLVVALATARPLPLGVRPETEPADAYLTALRSRLQGGGEMPSVDLALLTVRAAEPVARTPVRVKPHADRCANIVNRAQLGETLTDADLALLRSDCRQ